MKYLGIPSKESGKTTFIECPVHEQRTGSRDRHINNCVLGKSVNGKKAFYCHSCHGSGNGFDLIAGYLNLDIKKDFVQILKIAAESCGGEEAFIISDKEYAEKKQKKESQEIFGVLADELQELGLQTNLFTNSYIASYDESQITDDYDMKKDINFDIFNEHQLNKVSYLECNSQNRLFSSLNKSVYYDMIKEKAIEKMNLYKDLSTDQDLCKNKAFSSIAISQRQYMAEELKNEFRQKYIRIEDIYRKVATSDEILQIDNSWLYEVHLEESKKKPGSLF